MEKKRNLTIFHPKKHEKTPRPGTRFSPHDFDSLLFSTLVQTWLERNQCENTKNGEVGLAGPNNKYCISDVAQQNVQKKRDKSFVKIIGSRIFYRFIQNIPKKTERKVVFSDRFPNLGDPWTGRIHNLYILLLARRPVNRLHLKKKQGWFRTTGCHNKMLLLQRNCYTPVEVEYVCKHSRIHQYFFGTTMQKPCASVPKDKGHVPVVFGIEIGGVPGISREKSCFAGL